jgi:hypothetical protein
MAEIWKDVPGYKGFYKASNFGRIKRLYKTKEKILSAKPRINKPRCGYIFATLSKHGTDRDYPIHQIIASCFLSPKPFKKAEINHKDFVKTNNRPNNLEWCTHAENMRHAFKRNANIRKTAFSFGIRTREINNKLTKQQVIEIRNMLANGKPCRDIASIFHVCRKSIGNIKHGKTWSWLSSPHSQFP